MISGTPTALAAQATYTVTATNSGGSTTVGLVITVNDAAPISLTYSTNPAVYTRGVAIPSNVPSELRRRRGVLLGLALRCRRASSLDTATGVISGTPTAIVAAAHATR